MPGLIKQFMVVAAFALLQPDLASGATQPPVSLELSIPTANTYVIGDAIELHWEFRNHSTNNLTFMWEGCCRVNGRVDMKRIGAPVPPPNGVRPSHVGYGPGIYNASCQHCRMERQKSELTVSSAAQGPTMSHMFARAVRLPANSAQKFKTDLANWVLLEATGDYKLSGGYLGVHPKQRPQMPRGAKLWDGITSSPTIELSLLTVADYLAEREARQKARGLELVLDSPQQPSLDSPTKLAVSISNTSARPITIQWPGDVALWVVDSKGRRLPESRYVVSSSSTPLTIGKSESKTVTFPIPVNFFAGKPFGDYQVFVELKAAINSIRTPSNPNKISWNLNAKGLHKLILQAVERPAVGHRNPPLRLMRMHLAEISSTLATIDTSAFTNKARSLKQDLQTAASLKPLQVRPGTATLNLRIAADGSASFQSPFIKKALGNKNALETLAEIVRLRRHLGWMIAINLRIDRSARLSDVNRWIAALEPFRKDLAKAPRTRAFNSTATAFAEIIFASAASPPSSNQVRARGSLTWADFLKSASSEIDSGKAFELAVTP